MRSNSKHTIEELERYIELYLDDGIPILQLARKYNIPSDSTVRSWLIKYTEGEENRRYSPKLEVYTMKGLKISSRYAAIKLVCGAVIGIGARTIDNRRDSSQFMCGKQSCFFLIDRPIVL